MNKVNELLKLSKTGSVLLQTNENIVDHNFYYFTGLDRQRNFNSTLILSKNSKPVVLANNLEYGNIKNEKSFIPRNVMTREEYYKILKKSLSKKVGINFSTTSLASMKYIRKNIKGKKFVDISKELSIVRSTKSKDEIKKLDSAAKITLEIVDALKNTINACMKECDIESTAGNLMKKYGVIPSFAPIIASGRNSSVPHHISGKRKIMKNDVLLIDMGVVFENYCSDITRMFVVGKPSDEISQSYNFVKKAQDMAFSMLREGASAGKICKDVNDTLVKTTKQSLIHSLGHGIGLQVHDFPDGLSPKSKSVIMENMVFSVEPGYYGKNYGIRIEDMCVIKKNGCSMLSKSPKNIIEI